MALGYAHLKLPTGNVLIENKLTDASDVVQELDFNLTDASDVQQQIFFDEAPTYDYPEPDIDAAVRYGRYFKAGGGTRQFKASGTRTFKA